ncbi:MAG: metallophosphoesterase [Planctomycetota bacterium]|jgi:hypothetical protein
MPQTIVDLLKDGAEANHADRSRQGNLIHLPAHGSLIVTGDLHGHRRNFERITAYADLANQPDRHIVLQEIIHGGPADSEGDCLSYELLFDVVRYKLSFPDRVHVIMGNHDIACMNDDEVIKNGKEMNRSINSALDREFGTSSSEVRRAIKGFLFSQPLAVRCQNRIWLSHSLPSDRYLEEFDCEVFNRALREDDLVRPGPAYVLIWGRNHSQSLLNQMAKLFDVNIFILGHQPQQQGWGVAGTNLIIVASDHNHGCLLAVELARSYTVEQILEQIIPLPSIA